MNFDLPYLPQRATIPRNKGVTMVMDKGISLQEAEMMLDASADYIDVVKLGFGTSLISKDLKKKVKLYRDAGKSVYFGGTLFEAF